jgi:hypothetical protein
MVVSIGLPEDSRHAVRLLTECEAFFATLGAKSAGIAGVRLVNPYLVCNTNNNNWNRDS